MLLYGAAFFCLEPEPTQFGRNRSRLRDLGLPEPEPPKKSGGSATLLKHQYLLNFKFVIIQKPFPVFKLFSFSRCE